MADKGQQPSGVISVVLRHNPDDLVKWREERQISQEGFGDLNKKRAQVDSLLKGDKAFLVAAQEFLALIAIDPDSKLSPEDLDMLKTDVFNKTAEEIAKAEKKKVEEQEKKESERKQKEGLKLNGPAAVEAAIATIGQVCDDRKYNRMYQQRIRELVAGIKKAQKTTFFKNCLVLAQQPNQQYGEGIAVPPLVLSLVQLAWIDDDLERLKAFQNSALMQEVK